jgi:DNA replication and repair protein RecF
VQTLGGRILIEVEIPSTGRASAVRVNRSPVRRKRELRSSVRGVFFGPDDLDIVRGDPSERRRFMDQALAALWPSRESLLTAYERVLRQRNRLLKEWGGTGVPTALDTWDGELVRTGASLMRSRVDAVAALAPSASVEFEAIAAYGLDCVYRPSVRDGDDARLEDRFEAQLAERRPDELARRTSLVGPHRDELELAVRDLGARAFGSHGEAWAAALCLRLGLASAIEREVAEPPIVLVDDPFSALDPARGSRAAARLAGHGQAFVSVADESHVPETAAAVWDVSSGAVRARRAA